MTIQKIGEFIATYWTSGFLILATIGTIVSNIKSENAQGEIKAFTSHTDGLVRKIDLLTLQNTDAINKSNFLVKKIDRLTKKIDADAMAREASQPKHGSWQSSALRWISFQNIQVSVGDKIFPVTTNHGPNQSFIIGSIKANQRVKPLPFGNVLIPFIIDQTNESNYTFSFRLTNERNQPIIEMVKGDYTIYNNATEQYRLEVEANKFQLISNLGVVIISVDVTNPVIKIRGVFNDSFTDQMLVVGDNTNQSVFKDPMKIMELSQRLITKLVFKKRK